MEKRAEFLISGVRYNDDKSQIAYLKRHRVRNSGADESEFVSRHVVLEEIRQGINYSTAMKDRRGHLKESDPIFLYRDKYLHSGATKEERDNLERLPEV